MKFDRKYGVKGSTLAAAAAAVDSETEPEVSEDAVTPSRIASELEDKVRLMWDEGKDSPSHKRMIDKLKELTAHNSLDATGYQLTVTPSPRHYGFNFKNYKIYPYTCKGGKIANGLLFSSQLFPR